MSNSGCAATSVAVKWDIHRVAVLRGYVGSRCWSSSLQALHSGSGRTILVKRMLTRCRYFPTRTLIACLSVPQFWRHVEGVPALQSGIDEHCLWERCRFPGPVHTACPPYHCARCPRRCPVVLPRLQDASMHTPSDPGSGRHQFLSHVHRRVVVELQRLQRLLQCGASRP